MPTKGIASLLSKLASKVRGRRFPKGPPQPGWEHGVNPLVPPEPLTPPLLGMPDRQFQGHRGYALRSLKEGEMDVSPENKAKWRGLTQNEAAGFFFNGEPIMVHSSNVVGAQYRRAEHTMVVVFGKGKNAKGGAYRYSNISDDDAQGFLEAGSKGGWVWSVLRVRGSKTAHKKPYEKIAGFLPTEHKEEWQKIVDEAES